MRGRRRRALLPRPLVGIVHDDGGLVSVHVARGQQLHGPHVTRGQRLHGEHGQRLRLRKPVPRDAPALDGQRTLAVQAAVQRAAGPGSEVGLSAASPLERQTELRQRAAGLEQTVDAGASPAPTRSAEQEACLDAARSALERDAEAGAADLGLTAQPETAATTGGGPTTTPAPSFTASPDAEVTPLGVRVTVYPTEEAARAALEDARAAAQACTGVDLAGLGVERVTRTEHEGGTAYTALPAPGGSVYSHLTAVQDGARTVAVAQADADGGVPPDAEDRAASIVADVLAALDGEG
ncbi:hypothetical protein [Micrococcus luteus]|uniref:hypothetical protein n=1 Tax=Micrococcus luteus TaxID=1270 RepID=UPI0021CC6AA8|nr:hypothetical protein [Micrococcus luteus]